MDNRPGILQLALDEEGDGQALASFAAWSDVLDVLFDENETCGLTADDQLLSAATSISFLQHFFTRDLDYEPVCVYLDDGSGTAGPNGFLTTLWVLEVDPDLDETHRRMLRRPAS